MKWDRSCDLAHGDQNVREFEDDVHIAQRTDKGAPDSRSDGSTAGRPAKRRRANQARQSGLFQPVSVACVSHVLCSALWEVRSFEEL